jgi:NAD(P)-dependent dehydrogenase (short-subunit alcohol dehydrogenase family)
MGETEAFAGHLSSIGGRSIAIRADVTVQSDIQQMIARTIDEFGGLECVINNAGVGTVVPLTNLDEGTFEQTLRSNLVSAFLVSQAALAENDRSPGAVDLSVLWCSEVGRSAVRWAARRSKSCGAVCTERSSI